MPAGHTAMHTTAPAVETEPPEQGAHAEAPVEAAYEPAAQLGHALLEPIAEDAVPAGHCAQDATALTPPVVEPTVPEGQGEQAVAPASDE